MTWCVHFSSTKKSGKLDILSLSDKHTLPFPLAPYHWVKIPKLQMCSCPSSNIDQWHLFSLVLTNIKWIYQFRFNTLNDIIHIIFISFIFLWPQFFMEASASWSPTHNFGRRCCSCHHMSCKCPPISCALHASNSNNSSFGFGISVHCLLQWHVWWDRIERCLGRWCWNSMGSILSKLLMYCGQPLAASSYPLSKL